MENQEESIENQERRAYVMGMKFKKLGLNQDVIYAKIEKSGIPAELAKQVAKDVTIERAKEARKEEEPFYHIALIKIGIAVVVLLATWIFLPTYTILPVGLLVGGIVFVLKFKSDHK